MFFGFEDYCWFDQSGRLLKNPDPSFVYRAVSEESLKTFSDLSARGALKPLFRAGLIETELSSQTIPGYGGVLKHKRIPFVSEPSEWTMRMLYEAGKMICSLTLLLDQYGYGLQDAHPWNVAFVNSQPVFFDWGSVVKADRVIRQAWLLEFRRHIYLPLWLYSKGLRTLSYESLWERRGGSAKYIFNHPQLRFLPYSYNLLLRQKRTADFSKILLSLSALMEKIQLKDRAGFWSDYDQTSYPYKDQSFHEFLNMIPVPSDIIDLGCNRGAYAIACSNSGHRVVACDYDEKAIDYLFDTVRKNSNNVLPLKVDIMRPTPSYGPDLTSPNIFERLNSDYAIAFAISHHLARNYSLTFEAFARILGKYARKGILAEYVDLKDVHLQSWIERGWKPPAWYTEEGFVSAFSNEFRLERSWQTAPGDKNIRKIFYFIRNDA